MAGSLNVFNLGSLGVNVDKNAVQLEDGELTKAQNAIHDPTGSMGGVRKRPGLLKLNSSAVSGSVFGICNIPIAPVTTRTFYVGIDQAVTTAYQWVKSADAFGTTATSTTPGACAKPDDAIQTLGTTLLSNRGCQSETLFLYPGNYTRGTAQPIRAWDGTVDVEFLKIPLNSKTITDQTLADYAIRAGGIPSMKLEGSKLYIVSQDYIKAATGGYSRIFEYDLNSGVLLQVGEGTSGWDGDIGAASTGGATGAGTQLFYCTALHQGYLYAGVGSFETTNSTASGVYRIRPGVDATWTYDYDNSGAGDADYEVPLCMASYKGLLYVGMWDLNSTTSRVMVRSAAGAYTASLTIGNANGSAITDMIVFGDNLYVCAFDNNGGSSITTIRKFDGSSWSTVKTIDTGTSTPRVGVAMLVHNDRLYVLAINTSQNAIVTHTADGTSWTDQTSGLTSNNVVSILGVVTD